MWEMIPNDFDVSLISEHDEKRLFAKRRDMIWHFVRSIPGENSDPENGWFNWDIAQTHLPRFLIAKAVKELNEFNSISRDGFNSEDRVVTDESQDLGVYSRGPGSFDIDLLETEKGWPVNIIDEISEDICSLDLCQERIKLENGVYSLPGLQTPAGHPVSCEIRELIEAISFEYITLNKLDAKQIGPFAAYCIWRDLIIEEGLPSSYFEQLVANQFKYDAENFRESPFLDLVMEVQSFLFSKPIWGIADDRAIFLPVEEATEILREAMGKLGGFQLMQFWLMDKLHGAGLFLPLAQVIGINSWNQYAVWQTQGLQPDSEDEQFIRASTAFIKMVGSFLDRE